MGKKLLVTGCGGFVGGAVLAQAGPFFGVIEGLERVWALGKTMATP